MIDPVHTAMLNIDLQAGIVSAEGVNPIGKMIA